MANPVEQAKEQMNKSVENTKENFAGIRTGRANPALLNGIVVDYYGAPTPLKAVASIGVPEPRTLSVTPCDGSQASKGEKALRDSDLGVNPNRDGNVIRITMPELTSERRKEYVKLAKSKAEDGKVAVRNIRRKTKETIDKAVKEAEQFAAEDKKHKDEVDTHNAADQVIYQTEKTLNELGDKVSPSEKSECEAKLNALKEALKGTDIEAIKAKQDDLQKAFYAISEKVYQQAAQQQGQQPGADAQQGPTGNAGSAPKDDGAVDADFHEV